MTGEGYGEEEFQAELSRIRAIPADKIHFYEVSDVIRPKPALLQGSQFDDFHSAQVKAGTARPLFTWSMCGRCIPLIGKNAGDDVNSIEDLGAAKCIEVTKAVFSTGFRGECISSSWTTSVSASSFPVITGPCSWEVFEQQYMNTTDETVPARYAKAGQLSKEQLFRAICD